MSLVLASSSPRRKELLEQIGLDFSICKSDFLEESILEKNPEELVKKLAYNKALSVSHLFQDKLILAADTIVVLDDEILGKPKDEEDAFRMLKSLSARKHEVLTGICLLDTKKAGRSLVDVERTKVWFRKIDDEEIKNYILSGEAFDKAGSYGIQGLGTLFVDRIEGCYNNVVGLPLNLLNENLKKFDMGVLNI